MQNMLVPGHLTDADWTQVFVFLGKTVGPLTLNNVYAGRGARWWERRSSRHLWLLCDRNVKTGKMATRGLQDLMGLDG